jgi:hypothetical protein
MRIYKRVTTCVGVNDSECVEFKIVDLMNPKGQYHDDIELSLSTAETLYSKLGEALGHLAEAFNLTKEELFVAMKDKIGAIKMYRDRTGRGLKDGKDAVEEAITAEIQSYGAAPLVQEPVLPNHNDMVTDTDCPF